MKLYASKQLVDDIKNMQEKSTGCLFGRFVKSAGVVQITGLTSCMCEGVVVSPVGAFFRQEAGTASNRDIKGVQLYVTSKVDATVNGEHVQVNLYDADDYHSRHRSRLISRKLSSQTKTVAMVGLGSLGSKIAPELAKHGIKLLNFDPDTVSIANPYRMGLSLPVELLVGLPKIYAMEEQIRLLCPGATILSHQWDVCRESEAFMQVLRDEKPDLIVLTTDTQDSITAVNAAARKSNTPVLHCVLSDGAESGQIRLMSGRKDDACLLCMEPPHGSTMRHTNRQYAEEDSAAQSAVPSLSVDTSIIASIAAKLSLAFLAGEDMSKYFSQAGNAGDIMWISTTPDTWVLEDFCQKVVAEVCKTENCAGCHEPSHEEIRKRHEERKEMSHA